MTTANIKYVKWYRLPSMAVGAFFIYCPDFCGNGRKEQTFIHIRFWELDLSWVKRWLEGEDGSVLRQVPGKPVYSATLVKYADLLCSRPNGQGMLSGITES